MSPRGTWVEGQEEYQSDDFPTSPPPPQTGILQGMSPPIVQRLTLTQTLTRPALIRCNALEVCRWAPGLAPAVADALATGAGRHVVRSVAGFAPKLRPLSQVFIFFSK